jgi:hypothetical protein
MGNAQVEPGDEVQYYEQGNEIMESEGNPSAAKGGEIISKSEAKGVENQDTPPLTDSTSPPKTEKKVETAEKKTTSAAARKIKAETKQEEAEEEVDAMEVLFQFIPFYGQGDTSNDSIVRSTLSGLSIEDIDHRDEYGNTLLLVACQYRCEAIVRILLNKGADPNASNTSGARPLHFACYKETMSKSIAKLLLQNGANPEVNETTYGCTPLHYCAGTGDTDFCKMLISYGAHIGTYDYYDYTCVDYAREAGMNETAMFLQKKMLMTASQGPGAFAMTKNANMFFGKNDGIVSSHQTAISFGVGAPPASATSVSNDWIECIDPTTNSRYYMHRLNGECLWENDYLQKISKESNGTSGANGQANHSDLQRVNSAMLLDSNDDLLGGVPKQRLTVETNQKQSSDSATSPMKLSASMRDIHSGAGGGGGGNGYGPPSSNADPNAIKKLLEEAKLQSDEVLEKERLKFQSKIAEREGKIAKLESENETLLREKERIENELIAARKQYTDSSTSGGEAYLESQRVINQLEEENKSLKLELKQTQGILSREQEKLKSLEVTLHSLEVGHEERIQLEKEAAEERWRREQEMETKHQTDLREAEKVYLENKMKYQNEINEAKGEYHRLVHETEERITIYKRERDQEMEGLNASIAITKAKLAEEISHAKGEVESYIKKYEEAEERVKIAEEAQRQMIAEIEEAKCIQQYNAQLHRDLAREQAVRKKLHNEIEDMKGKIRVYVRVRPFSKSELSKGCHEAVLKDGKMSVVVTGGKTPETRKAYDFDSVFAGAMTEGNSQEDIFKDTKHLMTSVIDGYNVCIFAYGQTGSG